MNTKTKWIIGGFVIAVIIVSATKFANPSLQKGFFQKIPISVPRISKIVKRQNQTISSKNSATETACDQGISITKYVSVLGNNSNDGSERSPWRDVQYAIDQIPDRSKLMLGDGRFDGSLLISRKNIIVMGAGKRRTFITTNVDSRQPAVSIIESPQVCIRDLSISGTLIDGGGHWPQELREGIYSESSTVQINNTSLFNIFNGYIILFKTSFLIKNVELGGNEIGNPGVADQGIAIVDSQGTIDGLLTNEFSGIDHIIDRSNTLLRYTNEGGVWTEITDSSKPLIVKNSTFIASEGNWGDGIRFSGNGKNEVSIMNNIFQGRPEIEPFGWSGQVPTGPNGININGGHFIISNNIIRGYSNGMRISVTNAFYRDTPHTSVTLSGNTFENNIIGILNGGSADIANVYDEDHIPHLHYDFGGGEFHSPGRNVFSNRNFDVYQRNNAPIPALNNIWNAESPEEIEERLYDQLDDLVLGRVMHQIRLPVPIP